MNREKCSTCDGSGTVQGAIRDGNDFITTEGACSTCTGTGFMRTTTMDLPGTTDHAGAMDKAVAALEAELDRAAARQAVFNNPTTILNLVKRCLEGAITWHEVGLQAEEIKEREKKHLAERRPA